MDSANRKVLFLKDRFDSMLVAVCAKLMRWLSLGHAFLQNVSEDSRLDLVQLIALLLALPIFHLHNAVFEFAYAANLRKAVRLRMQCVALSFSDHAVQLHDFGVNRGRITEIKNWP